MTRKTPVTRDKAVARRRTQKAGTKRALPPKAAPIAKRGSSAGATKLDRIEAVLRTKGGATIPDLMEVTGWQAHSVRGVLAGALKGRGHTIVSTKTGTERRYRIESAV